MLRLETGTVPQIQHQTSIRSSSRLQQSTQESNRLPPFERLCPFEFGTLITCSLLHSEVVQILVLKAPMARMLDSPDPPDLSSAPSPLPQTVHCTCSSKLARQGTYSESPNSSKVVTGRKTTFRGDCSLQLRRTRRLLRATC